MSEIGKYIYGVINSNANLHLSAPKELFDKERRETNGIYAIPYQDIGALVSDSEIVDYTHMFKDALAKLLVRHQTVIERIMSVGSTVIPVRLGTFALDEVEVKDILQKGYTLIKDIIEKASDKIEIDITATWSDLASVLKETGEEKEIKDFKEVLLVDPKGITIDDQMKMGVMVKKALDKKREKYNSRAQDVLKTISQDFKVHEVMDDKMVINFAFLISRDKQKDFEEKIEELNMEFNERLNFRCIGPLPPYSFYTLEIKKLKFEEINWAKKKLGILNDSIAKDEVKKTYHRLAFFFHPDKNPNKPGTEKEFDDVKKSYNILLDYCQSCEQADQENLFFNEDEFKKNALLVKLRD